MACPICNNPDKRYSFLIKDYEYNILDSTTYHECNKCEAIYRNETLTNQEEQKLYDKKSYKPVKGGVIYDNLKIINAKYEKHIILKLLAKNEIKYPEKILDIACGKGYLLGQFAKNKNTECFGLDINININKNKIKFIKSSYSNLNVIKNIEPDLIIINNFLEHMENYATLNKLLSSMKNNSSIIIITPNSNSKGRRYFQDCWSGFHAPRHKTIFNEKNILNIFEIRKSNILKTSKLYDPITNLISANNLFKELKENKSLNSYKKLFFIPFVLFLDIFNKNRLIILIKKN